MERKKFDLKELVSRQSGVRSSYETPVRNTSSYHQVEDNYHNTPMTYSYQQSKLQP